MPIREIDVHSQIRDAHNFALSLAANLPDVGGGAPGPGRVPLPPVWKVNHQPVYTVGLRALTQRRVSATQAGWNFLSGDGSRVMGGDVPYVKPAPNLTSSRSEGRAVEAAAGVLQGLDTIPEIARSNENFERRLLRIPGLLIEAFWLKAPPYDDVLSGYDFVCPFHTYERRLAGKRTFTMTEFLGIVRPLALRRLGQRTPA